MFRRRQRYRCKNCLKTFGSTPKSKRFNSLLFRDYALGKQTLVQLSKQFKLSLPTLQKYLDQVALPKCRSTPKPIVLVLDATYFGEKKAQDGLIVGKDWLSKDIVYYKFIQSETKVVFQHVRDTLEQEGYSIQAVVVDGRPGIKSAFKGIPIQMCQFHQIQIVNRYLTKNPKLIPSLQLKTIVEDLSKTNEIIFKKRFNYWLEVNGEFLNETTINPEKKVYLQTQKAQKRS